MIYLLVTLSLFLCAAIAACAYLYAERKQLAKTVGDREAEIKFHIERRDADITQLRTDRAKELDLASAVHSSLVSQMRADFREEQTRHFEAFAERLRELRSLKDEEIGHLRAAAQLLREEARDWQNKTLARNSMTPLGEEREEARTPPGLAATSDAFDLRPPYARAQQQWADEEERREEQSGAGLPPDLRNDLLDGAREALTA